MKVADVMRKSVARVAPADTIRDVARLIFSLGINGVPVVDEEKLIGFIAEEDIFKKINSTLSKAGKTKSKNFESTDKNIEEVLDSPVKRIMNQDVESVSPEDSIMNAQSIMYLKHYSRLPVVDKNKNLLGMVSERDIFREIVKYEMPNLEKERYIDFKSRDYDSLVDWDKRFKNEIPELLSQFKKYSIESIIDIGTWSGEISIELANRGVKKILSLDQNPQMIEISKAKQSKMKPNKAKAITFELSNYEKIEDNVKEIFDAALIVGNSLPYNPVPIGILFKKISKMLRPKKAILIIQMINLNKIINNGSLLAFNIKDSGSTSEKEHMLVEFFDADVQNKLLQHVVTFDNQAGNWVFKGLASIRITSYTKEDLEKALKAAGFNKITFSGSIGNYPNDFGKLDFTQAFNPKESDWINVLAERDNK